MSCVISSVPKYKKRQLAHPIFEAIAAAVMAEGQDNNNSRCLIRALVEWAYNKFPKEVRYASATGVLTVRGKITKCYDLNSLTPEERKSVVVGVINTLLLVTEQQLPTASVAVTEEKPTVTDFSSMSKSTRNLLITRYVSSLQEIPTRMKATYKAAIHTGMLIKMIQPSRHVHLDGCKISRIDGIVYEPDLDRVVILAPP
jgi:hypothetical protein